MSSRDITPTLWCPQCQLWTKEYNYTGVHDCGTDVLSTGEGKQPCDIEYEGKALEN